MMAEADPRQQRTQYAGIKKYYADRAEGIRTEQQDGVRTTRHGYINLRISIENKNRATLNFAIVTFAGAGKAPVLECATPVAVSDACFECRRDADGQWIFAFHGAPIFIGNESFAKKALVGS